MNETYRGLIAACCDRPDDDTPRLVLADYLDDHDDPVRAAVIRAGVADPSITDPADGISYNAARDLIAPYAAVFGCTRFTGDHGTVGGVAKVGGYGRQWRINWSRGFPAELTVDAETWVQVGDELSWSPKDDRGCPVTACPALRVTLTTFPDYEVHARTGRARVKGCDREFLIPRGENLDHSRRGIATILLQMSWSSIRAWHLPPSTSVHGEESVLFVGGPRDGQFFRVETTGGHLPAAYIIPDPDDSPQTAVVAGPDAVTFRTLRYELRRAVHADGRRMPIYVAEGTTMGGLSAAARRFLAT